MRIPDRVTGYKLSTDITYVNSLHIYTYKLEDRFVNIPLYIVR